MTCEHMGERTVLNKQVKTHFKMYKSGRHWAYAAITVATVGIGVGFSSTQNTAATGDDGTNNQTGQITGTSEPNSPVTSGANSATNAGAQSGTSTVSEGSGNTESGTNSVGEQQTSQPAESASVNAGTTASQQGQITQSTSEPTTASEPTTTSEPSTTPTPSPAPEPSPVPGSPATNNGNGANQSTGSGTVITGNSVTIGGKTYTDPIVVEFEREQAILSANIKSGAPFPATFDNLQPVDVDLSKITYDNYINRTKFTNVQQGMYFLKTKTPDEWVADYANNTLPDVLAGNLAWNTDDFESNYNIDDYVHAKYQGTESDIESARYVYNIMLDKYRKITAATPTAFDNTQILTALVGAMGQVNLTHYVATGTAPATVAENIGQQVQVIQYVPNQNPQFDFQQAVMNLEPMTNEESQVTTIRMDMAVPDPDENYQVAGGVVLPSVNDSFFEFAIAKDGQSAHVLTVRNDGTVTGTTEVNATTSPLSLGSLVQTPNSKLTSTTASFMTDQNARVSVLIHDYDLNSTKNETQPTTSNLISFSEPVAYQEQLVPVVVTYYWLNVDGTRSVTNATQLAYVTGSPNNGLANDYQAVLALAAQVRDQFLIDHPDLYLSDDLGTPGDTQPVIPNMRQYSMDQWLIGSADSYAANHTLSNGLGGKKSVVVGNQIVQELANQPGMSGVALAYGYQSFDDMGRAGYTLQRVAELDANGQPMTVDGVVQETQWQLVAPAESPQSILMKSNLVQLSFHSQLSTP